ncbi:aldose 1-epimerase [Allomuricauda sp. SCSIO 65647]|uniref:aldose epimerase family protein n=1 Tax=Allomuricauda sp. SCSIO 65647 TaxID=2908843 RepID=UPI001F22F38D|nr:aldose 1-epimerase [Muricauda sp. SCSIO 65647]UJH66657.1 aldose 1-epimerase [Muricauda sp. SCSIO 65647]
MVELKLGKQTAGIDAGELVSYQVDGHEFIHQKGSPGWRNADTEMFPIIGPTNEAGFVVQVPRGNSILDQHGHLREMDYELVSQSETIASYRKEYEAGTPVKNSKYPEKSNRQWLMWPYSFVFEKTFSINENGLEIVFTVEGERDMPFMLGYHPAFKIHAQNPIIMADDREITLNEVLAVGSRALQVVDCESVVLKDEKELFITTEGFGHFMCWTEVKNMVCIEPITFYPYAVEQRKLHEGFEHLMEPTQFKVVLSVRP